MALIPIFRGLVTPDVQLRLRETERDRRKQWLSTLAGGPVEVLVRAERKQRTVPQNSWIHAGIVLPIAMETGDEPDAVKADLMRACWGTVPGADGKLEAWIGHTSSMNDEEAAYFIDWAPSYALRTFGVELLLPNEALVIR